MYDRKAGILLAIRLDISLLQDLLFLLLPVEN